MKHRFMKWAGIFAALAMCGTAHAQAPVAGAPQTAPTTKPKVFFYDRAERRGMAGATFAFERILGGFDRAVVKNAPFSAQVTRESTQVLADGNRIDRKETGMIARDSEGRTRREMSLREIGPLVAAGSVPHFVFIKDPAAGKGYVLNERQKTAWEMDVSFAGIRPRRMMRRGPAERSASETTESLGTKTMSGLKVEGTQTTRTIPAGQIGNEKAIVITTEEWYSPDLQTTVSLTRSDPRFGTTTYQLTNISRADPPQSLFIVPQAYTIKPAKSRVAKPAPPQD